MTDALLTTMRVALFVICTEGAIRYWRWWSSLRNVQTAGEFKIDLLALGLLYSSLSFFSVAAFLPAWLRTVVLLIGDPGVLTAAVLALLPCWRLDRAFHGRQPHVWMWLRGGLIIGIIAAIFLMKRFG